MEVKNIGIVLNFHSTQKHIKLIQCHAVFPKAAALAGWPQLDTFVTLKHTPATSINVFQYVVS